MSSDEAYSSFLDKANQDTGGDQASAQQMKTASKTARKEDVHSAIAEIDAYYVSESDEPFEPVTFDWEEGELDESSFQSLLSADADVSALTPKEFDPKGKYKQVTSAVGQAGDGEISIFKADFGGTRLEYYIVTMDKKRSQVVGVKARAVES